MRLVAHGERQLDLGLADRELHALAVMLDRHDVRALLGHELEQLDQLPGPVAEPGADDEVAACGRQSVPHHLDQRRRIDVAARQERAHLVLSPCLAGEHRCDRDRACTLHEQLRPFEQEHDRMADLLVRDGDDVVEQLAQDRSGERAGLLDRDPLRDREAVHVAAGERRDRLRLHADDANVGLERPQRDRDPGREPARRRPGGPGCRARGAAPRARGRSSPARR